jgi:SAM-dependent methyltransferase
MSQHHKWNEYYKRTQHSVPVEKIQWFTNRIPPHGCVLDIGAGFGRFATAFKEVRPDISVDALDNQPKAIEMLRANQSIDSVYDVSLERFTLPKQYHSIWAFNSLFFVEYSLLPILLSSLHAGLREGGTLFFSYLKNDPETDHHFPSMSRISKAELERHVTEAELVIEQISEEVRPFGEEKIDLCLMKIITTKPLSTNFT